MPTILESIKLFNETRNAQDFLTNPGVFTTLPKANVGERIKIVSKFRVFWELVANSVTSDVLTVAVVAGGHSLTSANQNFETAGFRVGDIFDFIDTPATPTLYAGQIITLISGNYMEFTLAGGLPVASFSDAVIKGTTDLDTLTYKFNFPASSNSQNLVNEIFGLIPEFTYKAMIKAGADVPGVASEPDYWNGGSSLARRLATVNTYEQVYEVETIIVIPDYREGQFEDIKGRDIPIPFSFETQFFKEGIDLRKGEDLTTSRPFDLIRSINDSIGWYNENFDGGPRQYSLVSLDYEELISGDSRDSIEVTESTKLTVVIAANNTTFSATDPAVLLFRNLFPETVYNSGEDDFNVTNNRESLRALIDGGPVSGTILTQFDVVLDNPTQITVTAVIVFDQGQQDRQENDSNYLLAIDLEDPALPVESSNRLNLIIDANSVTKNSDIPGLFSMTKDEVYYIKDEFEDGVSLGFTDLNAWNESLFMRDIEFDIITDPDEFVEIESMFAMIIAYNDVENIFFKIQNVTIPTSSIFVKNISSAGIQQISIDTTRGFLIDEDSQFNNLKVATKAFSVPNQTYSIQIGMMVDWQFWEQLLNADTVFYDVNQPNNGLNKKTSNYSDANDYDVRLAFLCNVKKNNSKGKPVVTPYLSIGPESLVFDFDLDKNVTPKYTNTFVFKDENNNVISKSAIKNEEVEFTATFDSAVVETSTNFEAIVKIEEKELGTERSKQIILTNENPLSGLALKPLDGETMLKKSVVGGNFTVQCLIDGNQLPEKKYSISAELIEIISLLIHTTFDKTNEYINFGNDSSLDFERTDAMSVTGWYWFDTISGDQVLFERIFSASGYRLNLDSSGRLLWLMSNNSSSSFSRILKLTSTTLSSGQWYHIALTKSISELAVDTRIYIDGVEASYSVSTSNSSVNISNIGDFLVGANDLVTKPLGGRSDKIIIYNDELTPSEVVTNRDFTRKLGLIGIGNEVSQFELDTLDPVDEIGVNDGLSINMDASNIVIG